MGAEPMSAEPPRVVALRAPVRADWEAVQVMLAEPLRSSVATVADVGRHMVLAGGKRLRPLTTLLAASACGYDGDRHIRLAVAIEFLHTATLLHDDVVDFSALRRHQPTARALWGNASSVLVGDFIYSRAFDLLVSIGDLDILAMIAETTTAIAEGEIMQLQCAGEPDTSEAVCLEVARRKTAVLFQTAAASAAALAQVSPERRAALSDYGLNLGMAFQLVDDLLDCVGDPQRTGKNVGDDLAEGIPTVPLAYAMRAGAPDDANAVREALVERRADRIDVVMAAVRRSGADEYARGLAEGYRAAARSALDALGDGPGVQALSALADFAVDREA